MMEREEHKKLDWLLLLLYFLFIIFGWLNVYSASVQDTSTSIFNLNYNYGKQFFWIAVAVSTGIVVLVLDTKFLEAISYLVYGLCILMLVGVLLFGREVNGARAWFEIGSFRLQPGEFAKIGTAMALARYMSNWDFSLDNARCRWVITGIIGLPVLLIIPEDTGTALVFVSFLFMLFREGISPVLMLLGLICVLLVSITLIWQSYWELVWLIIGLTALCWYFLFKRRYWLQHVLLGLLFIGIVSSVEFVLDYVLKSHQKTRILALFNPNTDPLGTGWNIIQSKIAVGSGGWLGKGFLSGTQTKYDFVPQQDTDFIFCTIGEEHGWIGSTLLLILFFVFLAQLLYVAENSKSKYARIYGYSVTGIFFFHIAINVGMVIGIAPVIGIPLPFFSYGGSSLLSFTIMLFMVLNHYSNRTNILMHER